MGHFQCSWGQAFSIANKSLQEWQIGHAWCSGALWTIPFGTVPLVRIEQKRTYFNKHSQENWFGIGTFWLERLRHHLDSFCLITSSSRWTDSMIGVQKNALTLLGWCLCRKPTHPRTCQRRFLLYLSALQCDLHGAIGAVGDFVGCTQLNADIGLI